MRETSLDDFTGGADEDGVDEGEARDEVEEPEVDESSAAESEADGSVLDEPDEPDEPEGDDSDPVEPAVSTYDWTPTGADCEACDAVVERRWRDDGRLVCADCKAW